MPNWKTNRITGLTRENISPYISKDEDGAEYLDFEKIAPMPSETEANWYDWRIANWGTKWNSKNFDDLFDLIDETGELYLETAWNAPLPIIRKLSEILGCEIEIIFGDECYGYGTGRAVYENGKELVCEYYGNMSPDAIGIAKILFGEDSEFEED